LAADDRCGSKAAAAQSSWDVRFTPESCPRLSPTSAGLVGGEGFAVDASLIVADANKQRSIPDDGGASVVSG